MKNYIKIIYEEKEIKVSEEIAEFLIADERRQNAQNKKDSRHLSDKLLENIEKVKIISNEQIVESKVISKLEIEVLLKAITTLTPIQKSRCIFYFFRGYTYRQIAEREGVSDMAVRVSINAAIKTIKKYF